MASKLKLALFFGGRSTEHEVSVITALQAYENLDLGKYEVVPVYTSKSGQSYSNTKFLDLGNYTDIDTLLLTSSQVTVVRLDGKPGVVEPKILPKFTPIDLAFPLFHGAFGEDGSIQGVFETFQIPYVGFNVMGSAVAMDKVVSKALFKDLGLNVGKYFTVSRIEWNENAEACLKEIQKQLKFPLFIKPADTGSTIGIGKARNEDELSFAIEVAAVYSDKILVEEAFEHCIEVNCAALGYKEITPSLCEAPISLSGVLTFEDKYLRYGKSSKGSKAGGMASLARKLPAPISKKLTQKIQNTTVKVFKALEGCGVARVDYFVNPETEDFWINEINSPPGSLAYYLYEPMGIPYKVLLDRIITAALERFREQKKTQFIFKSPLLTEMAKASKG